MSGGYGPKGHDTLRSALRAELSAKGFRRQVRIIETRCLGVCPKRAVTALNAGKPDKILTVPRETRPEDALALLLGGNYGDQTVLSHTGGHLEARHE